MQNRAKFLIVSALVLAARTHETFGQSAIAPSQNLDAAEIQTLQEQIEGNWSVPVGKEGEDFCSELLHVRLILSVSGAVRSSEIVDPASNDSLCADTRLSLLKAIQMSSPLHLPSNKFPHTVEFTFDLRGLMN
jgi:hypothetical protein